MRPSVTLASCLSLLLLLPTLASAQTQVTAATSPSLGGSVAQMLLGLAVVIALLIGSLWLLKRLTGTRNGNTNLVRVISSTALGTRERVVVVEIGQNWLVLGVTPSTVTTLSEMPRQALPPQDHASADVPKWLKKMLDKRNAKQAI